MMSGGEHLSVDGYIRVSRVGRRRGERFISPAVQRGLIESWALAHGARVLEVFEELDESGARADRPLLEKAIARVEAGLSQGVVVSKVDRFGRSLISGLAAIQQIAGAGGVFVAVQDGVDSRTETGRLVLRILLSLGEWESERIGVAWDQAMAKAVARGVYRSPGAPLGYRRTRSGRLWPDPALAWVIGEAFRRRGHCESFASLAKWFEHRGVLTTHGNRRGWTSISVSNVLRSRVYLGELRYGYLVNERAHEPLIDAASYQVTPEHPRPATSDTANGGQAQRPTA
jgi:site-specific DNA recombinase